MQQTLRSSVRSQACFGAASQRRALKVRAEAVTVPDTFSKIEPKGPRVLVKVAEQEVKTKGGILLPTSAQKRPTSGDVIALGDGREDNTVREFSLKLGDTVLYSKFGFMYTDLKQKDQEFILIREDDVIGIMPKSNAQADDIPEMRPLGDRVLLKVEDTADVTMGGVILPEVAKERPLLGTVVRTGPGKYDKDAPNHRKPMTLKEGDKVLYFKYAGDNMETPMGQKFVVLREDDVLCKA